MKVIRVTNEDDAQVVITSKTDIPLANEFTVRALAGIQLMLLNKTDKSDRILQGIVEILSQAVDTIITEELGNNDIN